MSLSLVRAKAVRHAPPVGLAAVSGALAVAAGARLVRLAPGPRLARPCLRCRLSRPVAGAPRGGCLLAPGRPGCRGRLPLAPPLGRGGLPLAGLEVGPLTAGVPQAPAGAARPARPGDRIPQGGAPTTAPGG